MKRLIAAALMLCLAGSVPAQKLWRGKHRRQTEAATTPAVKPMQAVDSGCVVASGFEKPLRSNIESLFLTNRGSDTISRVLISVEYLDITDRPLHSRSERLSLTLAPGDTRRVELRSFDRQGTFYYHLSTPPRTRGTATPFKVKLRVDSISTISKL